MAYERRDYSGAPASTTLASGINNSTTTISITSATGWPTVSGAGHFAVIDPGLATEEKVAVTARTTTTLTVTRGADDTSAAAHDSGATIYPCFSAVEADEANYWISELAAAYDTAGDLAVADGDDSVTTLAKGAASTVLQVDSGGTLQYGTVTSAMIADGAIVNADVNASAAIAYSKLNLANSVTESDLTTSVAGNGLTGGNGTALAVNVDDSTLAISTDQVIVKDAGVTAAKLAAAVAGAGLTGGAGTALAVNVDDSTLEVATDTVQVKDGGLTMAKAASGLRFIQVGTSEPTVAEGDIWTETDVDRIHAYDGSASQRIAHWSSTGRTGGSWSRSTNQSINDVTTTAITWTTEASDSDGFLTPTSATITIPAGLGGIYAFEARWVWSGAPGAGHTYYLMDSGSTVYQASAMGGNSSVGIGGIIYLAAAATLQVRVYQNSGGALNITSASLNLTRIAI